MALPVLGERLSILLARRICSARGDTLIITLTVWREPAIFFLAGEPSAKG